MCAAAPLLRCASACSSTPESTPRERPTRMLMPCTPSSARPTAAVTSALLGFLVLAIAHEPFQPAFHQLFRLLLLDLLQRLGERTLERLRGDRGVALRAAERLGHDLVDEAAGLQAVGGDAEGGGSLRRHVGAPPEDRGA